MSAPRKGTRRACDPCSVRKVRCDGQQPCSRCEASSWECTYLKTHGKSGPKGPRRTTEAAIKRLQERSRSSREDSNSNSEASLDASSPTQKKIYHVKAPTSSNDSTLDAADWIPLASRDLQLVHEKPQKLSTSCITQYLEIYRTQGYGIWPVVNTEALIAQRLQEPDDLESYALATAISAAVSSQFALDVELANSTSNEPRIPASIFEIEAKRARDDADHMENITIFSILASFFLHVYSANINRMNASTTLLGEAITKAHILGLHKASHYAPMSMKQVQANLRVYWLLFITERAHSIQHDVPTTLKRANDLPSLENLNDGSVTPAFVQLCRLFNILDVTITANPTTARGALAVAQQQLTCDEASLNLENELQRADIAMTQQWMRIFLWQHALNVTNLSGMDDNDEFSFSFPAKVAQNVLGNLNSLSKQSVEAHGPGMESKLFDVANSLADVMLIMPTMNQESNFIVGPRDLIHSLTQILSSFRGGNPAVISVLQDKLNALGISTGSPQRILELSSPEEEHEEWHEQALRPIPTCLTLSDIPVLSPAVGMLSPYSDLNAPF